MRRQRVKPRTKWRGGALVASMLGEGLVGSSQEATGTGAFAVELGGVSLSGSGELSTDFTTPTTFEEDWEERISQPGVVWYHDFRWQSEVDQFRWSSANGNGNDPLDEGRPGTVTQVRGDGVTGGACLEIYRAAGSTDPAVWWRPFSPFEAPGNGREDDDPADGDQISLETWAPTDGGSQTTSFHDGNYGHSTYHGTGSFDGTEYYLQMRVKIDPARIQGTNGNGGKLLYLSRTEASLTSQEIVVESAQAVNGANYFSMYRSGGQPLEQDAPGTTTHGNQPGTEFGSVSDGICRFDDTGGRRANCWSWPLGEWCTVMWHVRPGTDGGNDSLIRVYVAGPHETEYTKIWDQPGADLQFDANKPFGQNALILSAYMNGGTLNINTPFYHRFDQVIFSRQFIAPPKVPLPEAPAWFENLDELEWTEVAGGSSYSGSAYQKGARLFDVRPDPLPLGTGHIDLIRAWNSAAVLQGRREYLKICEGGHLAYSGNEIYALALGEDVPEWKRIWGPTPNDLIDRTGTGYNNWQKNLDGTPRTHHGWHTRLCTEDDGRLWLMATGDQGLGEWTTDVWSIRREDCIGEYDPSVWEYRGKAWPSFSGNPGSAFGYQGIATAYDLVTRRFVIATEFAVSGNDKARAFDKDAVIAAGKITSDGVQFGGSYVGYTGSRGNEGTATMAYSPSAIVDSRYYVVVTTRLNLIRVLDLDANPTDGWAIYTVSGLDTYTRGGAVFHPGRRKFIIGASSGSTQPSTIGILTVPEDPMDADNEDWELTNLSTSGTLSSLSNLAAANMMFNVVLDMGNGQACCVAHLRDTDEPTQVLKLPVDF